MIFNQRSVVYKSATIITATDFGVSLVNMQPASSSPNLYARCE